MSGVRRSTFVAPVGASPPSAWLVFVPAFFGTIVGNFVIALLFVVGL